MYGVSYQGYEFRLEEYYSQHDPFPTQSMQLPNILTVQDPTPAYIKL